MIDLSRIPPPTIISQLSVDEILEQRLAKLQELGVTIDNFAPSDPVYRNLLASSYREMILRQEINEQCLGNLLAFANGAQIDQIGATYYQVERLTGESDDDFKRRIQLSPEASSVAGPVGKYIFEALSADPDVKDATWESPQPMHGTITILSRVGDGTPAQALLDIVSSHIKDDGVRPQTDLIAVAPPTIQSYTITATLQLQTGPDTSQVISNAQAQLQTYVNSQHRLGGQVVLAGVYGALMVEGVVDVTLDGFNEIRANDKTAPYCSGLTVTGG